MSDLVDRITQEIRERREVLDSRQRTATLAANNWNVGWRPVGWRIGRKVGRTIYVQSTLENRDHDQLIGCMDSVAFTEHIVLNDPWAVLADIARQRAMLDGFKEIVRLHTSNAQTREVANRPTLRAIATALRIPIAD